jgi:hypothetical protein
MAAKQPSTIFCDFCGKSQHVVKKVIAGPKNDFICNECVSLCIEICLEGENGSLEPLSVVFPDVVEAIKSRSQSDDIDDLYRSLRTRPLYSYHGLDIKKDYCFYLGPFKDPFNIIYEDHVKPTVIHMGKQIDRADEIFGTRPIMQDIWDAIFCASLVIADVTGKNPNVMYEIGIAHAIGKPVIMLIQDISDVPFDLRHFRCVVYEYSPRGCNVLNGAISKTIESLEKVNYILPQNN